MMIFFLSLRRVLFFCVARVSLLVTRTVRNIVQRAEGKTVYLKSHASRYVGGFGCKDTNARGKIARVFGVVVGETQNVIARDTPTTTQAIGKVMSEDYVT